MNNDAIVDDHQPVLGDSIGVPSLFSTFQIWAKKHGQLTIGLQLVGLCNDGISQELLGGLLRFLSYLDTCQVLKKWKDDSPHIAALAELSSHLAVDFPKIPTPTNARSIRQQFARQLNFNYLCAQLSARNAPGLTSDEQFRMTRWRVWILIKALQFASSGDIYDESLLDVCANTRMALDEQGDTKRLSWFLTLIPRASELKEFEIALGEQAKQQPSAGIAGAEIVLRGIKSLLNDQRRPCATGAPNPAIFMSPDQWMAFERTPTSVGSVIELDLSAANLSDPALGDFTESDVHPNQTLPESVREARRIAFQSREDLHYLPFSWNRLRADERKAMELGIRSTLHGASDDTKLIAALTVVALVTRRSMETIASLPVGSISTDGWKLDVKNGCLHRLPARRHNRWRATEAAKPWIKPLSSDWVLHLNDAIRSVLKAALLANPGAATVGDLWPDAKKSLAAAFNAWCEATPGLYRVTSGFLVRTGEQVAFEESKDPVFSRLISSPARAGLPGSCAYPSWRQTAVAQALCKIGYPNVTMVSNDALNGMGSELDPDEELLSSAMGAAYARVIEFDASKTAWIEYHNHLTAYSIALLLACTGARPVESMFESSAHFNWEQALLYIEDKVVALGRDGRAGRVVPIPNVVRDFLTNVYLGHLRHLADCLQGNVPDMAQELRLQIAGKGSKKLPLFFFLRNRPDFQWIAVSESTFESVKIADLPLPLNLFRHRLATRLREFHFDPELIEAQLGHAEAGAETYGDHSFRCWSTDLPHWRAAIAKSFDALNLHFPTLVKVDVSGIDTDSRSELFPSHRSFGKDARANQRHGHQDSAVKKATEEIQAFVADRVLDAIPPDEWPRLGRQMVLTEHNLRHANALIRYETFERYLQEKWRETGQRPRLKKWITARPAPRSAFHMDSVHVGTRLKSVREEFDKAFANLKPRSTLALQEAAQFAALDLALNSGIAFPKLLGAVAGIDKVAVSLVVFQQRLHIEYSEARDARGASPVTRFLVPTRCARLLESAFSAKKSFASTPRTPESLRGICSALDLQWTADLPFQALIETVAKQIDRENSLTQPGVIAGILAGRVKGFALRHEDWIRALTGKSRLNPASQIQGPIRPEEVETVSTLKIAIGYVAKKDRDRNLKANRSFIAAIRKALTEYRSGELEQKADSEVAARRRNSNTETEARAITRSTIKSLVSRPDPEVSVACHALGCWVLGLLSQKYKKNLLDATSILRYLNALSPGFTQFGYDVDLADLDVDELTEFYSQILDPANPKEPDKEDDKKDSEKEKEEGTHVDSAASARRRNGQYVIERLIKFHRFAKTRYGLEDPDWSELSDGLFASTALPGYITLSEYLHAFDLICPTPINATPSQLQDAFVLLLTYRFGLRGGEAIAMHRNGWVDLGGAVVVLVDGSFRKLKTKGSNRQVPLLEDLEDKERTVIDRWLLHWDNQSLENPRIPLFFAHRIKGGIADISSIRSRLIEALRTVTGSTHINLHHARHSFANRIGLHLLLDDDDTTWHEQTRNFAHLSGHVKRTMLSTESATRRAPWALARLLGHAGPQTTFNSYLHFQFDLLTNRLIQLNPTLFRPLNGQRLECAVNLDDWNVNDCYLRSLPSMAANPMAEISPKLALEYMRLRAHGRTPVAARDVYSIHVEDQQRIENALVDAGGRLTRMLVAGSTVSDIVLPMGLLGRIQNRRWQNLIDWVGSLESPNASLSGLRQNAARQIGPTRQILFWEQQQFEELKNFLQWCDWSSTDIILYAPKNLDGTVKNWICGLSLGELRSPTNDEPAGSPQDPASTYREKRFQIDTVRVRENELPEVEHKHRVAVVRSTKNPNVQDNFELIMIWLAFLTGQPTNHPLGQL